ncbi:MAG: DNA polymerase III subunit beta [Pirellulales bacterium]|nr:DNA polymerase III subunit beta [Pirellulales bacterium]
MKVVCQRDKLLAAFQTASAVAPARSTKPILQNVKLEVRDGLATLVATDLEIGVRVDVPGVDVDAAGSVILPTGRFGSILRESSDQMLRLEAEARGTLVRGERSEFHLLGENPDEYPAVSGFQESAYQEVSARLFREMIRRTVFATDNESTRYALGGVLLEFAADQLTAVGTDGRRLATMHGPAKAVGGHQVADGTAIVPTKAMHLLERALVDPDAEIRLAVKAGTVLVQAGASTVSSRLVEGRFPRWRDVFPQRQDASRVEVMVGPFYAAVRQAAILTSDETRGVDFTFGEGRVVLTGRAAELGQSRVELPIGYDGPSIGITLDPRFVTDFLKVLDPESNFKIELKDSASAAVCSTSDGYGYVIMPLAREH